MYPKTIKALASYGLSLVNDTTIGTKIPKTKPILSIDSFEVIDNSISLYATATLFIWKTWNPHSTRA